MSGKLELIIGSMYSGKTTTLIQEIEKAKKDKNKVLCINHYCDQRYDTNNSIVSHDRLKTDAIKIKSLKECYSIDDFDQIQIIFIEEGQFFDDLEIFVKDLVMNKSKHVVVAALDGTYKQEPFVQVCNLIPFADKIVKLYAKCNVCGESAPFSKRICNDTKVLCVGSTDKYIAVCRKHL